MIRIAKTTLREHRIKATLLTFLVFLLPGCGGAEGTTATATQPGGDAVNGEKLYTTSCLICHGPGGGGVPGFGEKLTTSTVVSGKTDADLVEFVEQGRSATDPLNKSGVDMPPKGANPNLTRQDLLDIVAYLRTLQE